MPTGTPSHSTEESRAPAESASRENTSTLNLSPAQNKSWQNYRKEVEQLSKALAALGTTRSEQASKQITRKLNAIEKVAGSVDFNGEREEIEKIEKAVAALNTTLRTLSKEMEEREALSTKTLDPRIKEVESSDPRFSRKFTIDVPKDAVLNIDYSITQPFRFNHNLSLRGNTISRHLPEVGKSTRTSEVIDGKLRYTLELEPSCKGTFSIDINGAKTEIHHLTGAASTSSTTNAQTNVPSISFSAKDISRSFVAQAHLERQKSAVDELRVPKTPQIAISSKAEKGYKIFSRLEGVDAPSLTPEDGRLYNILSAERKAGGVQLALALNAVKEDGSATYRLYKSAGLVEGKQVEARWVSPPIEIAPTASRVQRNKSILKALERHQKTPNFEIESLSQEFSVRPIEFEQYPEHYELLQQAAEHGLRIKLNDVETSENGQVAVFQLYQETRLLNGQRQDNALTSLIRVPLGVEDYYEVRNNALSAAVIPHLENPPITLSSRVPDSFVSAIDCESSPELYQALRDEGLGLDKSLVHTKTTTVNGESCFEYQIVDRNNPERRLAAPIVRLASLSLTERNELVLERLKQIKHRELRSQSAAIYSEIKGISNLEISERFAPKHCAQLHELAAENKRLCLRSLSREGLTLQLRSSDGQALGEPFSISRAEFADEKTRDILLTQKTKAASERFSRWQEKGINLSRLVKHYPQASEEFRQAMEDNLFAFAEQRPFVFSQLYNDGAEFHFKNHTCEGGVPSSNSPRANLHRNKAGELVMVNWNNIRGLCKGKTVVVAEQTQNYDNKWTKLSDRGRADVLAHEIGHYYDVLKGRQFNGGAATTTQSSWVGSDGATKGPLLKNGFSHTEAFVIAYATDCSNLPENWKMKNGGPVSYYLQEHGAGREELFAELFEVAYRGGERKRYQELRERFPRCYHIVGELLANETPPDTLALR